MAGDQLFVDVDAIRSIASGLTTSGYSLPTEVPVDLEGSHSSAVSGAAENFGMWATVQTMLASGQITNAALVATEAAATWQETEALLEQDAS